MGGWMEDGCREDGLVVTGVDEGQEHIPGVKFCGSERTAPWISLVEAANVLQFPF